MVVTAYDWEGSWADLHEARRVLRLQRQYARMRLLGSVQAALPSGVYFAQAASGEGPVKIGYSGDPAKRLVLFQIGSPVLLAIWAVMPGQPADERRLHEEFAAFRLWGEWFQPADPILALMAEHEV